jgi:sugar diacid utilization regulator
VTAQIHDGEADGVVSRRHLTDLYGLFVLSMMLSDRTDRNQILRLAVSSVPYIGPCSVAAVFVRDGEHLVPWLGTPDPPSAVLSQVLSVGASGGAIVLADERWRYALPFQSRDGVLGYLVVEGDGEPSAGPFFLLRALGQQTAVALKSAESWQREQRQTRALELVNADLSRTVARLAHHDRVQSTLTEISAKGRGVAGIAQALHDLTGLFVFIDDEFGQRTAQAGTEPHTGGRPSLSHVLERTEGEVITGLSRERGHLVSVVRSGRDILGLIGVVDPDGLAGEPETFALQYATTSLELELAHQRSLAEVETRLSRDLVDDLIDGTDLDGAVARAAALHHDLRGPHVVMVIEWSHPPKRANPTQAVRTALSQQGMTALVSRRQNRAVAVVAAPVDSESAYHALVDQFGSQQVSVGVGSPVPTRSRLATSYTEASRALDIRRESLSPFGVTSYTDLGIYRVMGSADNRSSVDSFVREQLGALLDYDARRGAEMVRTLAVYLECGGNYDETAAALVVHRNTVRYRLRRVEELSGVDLSDVDSRLNLHVATRALQVLEGTRHFGGSGS